MTEDAKRAAKSEKKLKVLLGGYQVSQFYFFLNISLTFLIKVSVDWTI